MSKTELAERLAKAGRSIDRLSVLRIEATERRIDVDDLVALADALGVPADRLIFDDNLTVEVRVVNAA